MNDKPKDPFEGALRRIEHLPPHEQMDAMEKLMAGMLAVIDTSQVQEILQMTKEHHGVHQPCPCCCGVPGTRLLDLIEGQLALREIQDGDAREG